ncbi:imm68 putative immunity domain-containing protein [Corynebacterium pacaense]|uniref:imm68 putative immunity domain-containing protein n=1 Tax=Corynebacterium pacaense TaxID=1816684 RepID=UPI003CCC25B7
MALIAHLEATVDSGNPAIEVRQVFSDLGLDRLSGNYTDTRIEGFGDAFMLVAALAALIVESERLTFHVDSKENTQINTALKYFALSPEDHAAANRFDEDDLSEFADLSEQLRGRLD